MKSWDGDDVYTEGRVVWRMFVVPPGLRPRQIEKDRPKNPQSATWADNVNVLKRSAGPIAVAMGFSQYSLASGGQEQHLWE